MRTARNLRALLSIALLTGACIEGIDPSANTPLVQLPSTTFVMGGSYACQDGQKTICDAASSPSISVTISAYEIEAHEVTNAQYRHCVSLGLCTSPAHSGIEGAANYYREKAYADFPMVNTTWQMATDYCQSLGRRLPTEAEWEFAARYRSSANANDLPRFPWGDDDLDCNKAHTAECASDALPRRTASTLEDLSESQVHDLGGNVSEWVDDVYGPFSYCEGGQSYGEQCADEASCMASLCEQDGASCVRNCIDQQPLCEKSKTQPPSSAADATASLRSARGGAYRLGKCAAVASYRMGLDPNQAYPHVGFRCAK